MEEDRMAERRKFNSISLISKEYISSLRVSSVAFSIRSKHSVSLTKLD